MAADDCITTNQAYKSGRRISSAKMRIILIRAPLGKMKKIFFGNEKYDPRDSDCVMRSTRGGIGMSLRKSGNNCIESTGLVA